MKNNLISPKVHLKNILVQLKAWKKKQIKNQNTHFVQYVVDNVHILTNHP